MTRTHHLKGLKMTSYADREVQLCYQIGDITYVPHYSKVGVFVGPGHREFVDMLQNNNLTNEDRSVNEEQLIVAGASKIYLPLWPRFRRVEG